MAKRTTSATSVFGFFGRICFRFAPAGYSIGAFVFFADGACTASASAFRFLRFAAAAFGFLAGAAGAAVFGAAFVFLAAGADASVFRFLGAMLARYARPGLKHRERSHECQPQGASRFEIRRILRSRFVESCSVTTNACSEAMHAAYASEDQTRELAACNTLASKIEDNCLGPSSGRKSDALLS